MTARMVVTPTLAMDLPQKALAWEDFDGEVWLSYNYPDYLKRRDKIPDEWVENITGVGAVLEKAVE